MENGGAFCKKSGPFLNVGCIMYSISIFLFYILLIWGTHPRAYGPETIISTEKYTFTFLGYIVQIVC